MYISVDNVVLLNKPLSNLELVDAVKLLKIPHFRGVFMRNELIDERSDLLRSKKEECGILNLDDNDNLNDQYGTRTGGGTHWVAWWKDGNNKFYFDSYGLQPPTELINYLGAITYNTHQVQKAGTVICGHLCLYVLKRLSDGDSLQNIINNLI